MSAVPFFLVIQMTGKLLKTTTTPKRMVSYAITLFIYT